VSLAISTDKERKETAKAKKREMKREMKRETRTARKARPMSCGRGDVRSSSPSRPVA
jgi:hypothetical protein